MVGNYVFMYDSESSKTCLLKLKRLSSSSNAVFPNTGSKIMIIVGRDNHECLEVDVTNQ